MLFLWIKYCLKKYEPKKLLSSTVKYFIFHLLFKCLCQLNSDYAVDEIFFKKLVVTLVYKDEKYPHINFTLSNHVPEAVVVR